MIFAKNFARNYEKKKYLEHQTLDWWDEHSINPATQGIILKIFGFYGLVKFLTKYAGIEIQS